MTSLSSSSSRVMHPIETPPIPGMQGAPRPPRLSVMDLSESDGQPTPSRYAYAQRKYESQISLGFEEKGGTTPHAQVENRPLTPGSSRRHGVPSRRNPICPGDQVDERDTATPRLHKHMVPEYYDHLREKYEPHRLRKSAPSPSPGRDAGGTGIFDAEMHPKKSVTGDRLAKKIVSPPPSSLLEPPVQSKKIHSNMLASRNPILQQDDSFGDPAVPTISKKPTSRVFQESEEDFSHLYKRISKPVSSSASSSSSDVFNPPYLGGRPGSEECFRPGRHVNDVVGIDTIGSTLKNQFAGNLAIGESEVLTTIEKERRQHASDLIAKTREQAEVREYREQLKSRISGASGIFSQYAYEK